MKHSPPFIILLFSLVACNSTYPPEGFVHIKKVVPDVQYEIRYAGEENFLGKPVPGYRAPEAILSQPAAQALASVQEELKEKGLGLKIFDAYRPQRAVNHFIKWAADEKDTLKRSDYYPHLEKKDLFRLGYISGESGHSRGSTVDLTISDIITKRELDMGSPYDFFGAISHHGSSLVTQKQRANRELLRTTMEKHGFVFYPEEWWHYTLKDEPYEDTYFDFVVK